MLNLFIDTNIFLTFYRLPKVDWEELKKLVIAVDKTEINLYITQQVKDEFFRNRESVVKSALTQFRDLNFGKRPHICEAYSIECEELVAAEKKFYTARQKILHKIDFEMDSFALSPDKIIFELFNKAVQLESSDERLIRQAKHRFDCGNPPGKNSSYGDELNWETLLENDRLNGEDLYIISNDGDYANPANEDSFSPFLTREWQAKKSSKVYFYRELSKFFNEKYPGIKLATDFDKEIAIRKLVDSPAFAFTHSAIGYLSQCPVFSNAEVERMLRATIQNTQIYWIITDPDVSTFLDRITRENGERINQDLLNEFVSFRAEILEDERRKAEEMAAFYTENGL